MLKSGPVAGSLYALDDRRILPQADWRCRKRGSVQALPARQRQDCPASCGSNKNAMGSLKKRRKSKINKHKRRKKLRQHRHKKRTWQK